MNHESCRERLTELVYGELGGREAREVERHLETCAACRAERDGLLDTRAAMRRLEAPAAPGRLDPIVLAAARRAAAAREGGSFAAALRGFGAKLAAGTALAVLLAFVLVNVGRLGEKGPREMGRRASQSEAARRAEAPAAEPRLEPRAGSTEVAAKAGAEGEGAAPPARAPAPKEAKRAAPAAAPPSAPVRAAARPEAAAEVAAGEAAPRPRDESSVRGEYAKRPEPGRARDGRQLEEYEPDRREEGARGGAPAFAQRPLPPAPSVAASRRAAGAPAALAAAPSSIVSGPAAASAQAADEADSRSAEQRAERSRAAKAESAPGARAAGPMTRVARDIERRRAAGELSEAVRRLEPCPGGDLRRIAWIDHAEHVLKLRRERDDGTWVEEWFDASGRLREALVHGRAGGAPWTRRVVIGEDGTRTVEDEGTTGLAPATPPPPLVERDPSDAFFAGPGCGR